ncbi:hypothetical protein GMI70_06240 [Eggerthellaceae bacterium zg-893]|nr:hypothetical protein [Eggerthellaceae bacterium zg-893]
MGAAGLKKTTGKLGRALLAVALVGACAPVCAWADEADAPCAAVAEDPAPAEATEDVAPASGDLAPSADDLAGTDEAAASLSDPVANGGASIDPNAADDPAGVETAYSAEAATAAPVSETDVFALMTSIAGRYATTSDAWACMDMAAVGLLSSESKAALVDGAASAMQTPGAANAATAFQRTIIALTAVGEDATKVPDAAAGEPYDAVAAMADAVTAASPVNVLAFTLLAYEGGYDVPPDAKLTKEQLVAALTSKQLEDGGFAYHGSASDADMTAMVVAALAPAAQDDATLQPVVDEALGALHALQHDDGGWGATGMGVQTATNANSTAMAVVALCALGMDPATTWATASGSTPLSALLAQAAPDKTSFHYDGKPNNSATEQGFRALAAYRGLKNTNEPYNIYVQAKDHDATFPPTQPENPGGAEGPGAGQGGAEQPDPSQGGTESSGGAAHNPLHPTTSDQQPSGPDDQLQPTDEGAGASGAPATATTGRASAAASSLAGAQAAKVKSTPLAQTDDKAFYLMAGALGFSAAALAAAAGLAGRRRLCEAAAPRPRQDVEQDCK